MIASENDRNQELFQFPVWQRLFCNVCLALACNQNPNKILMLFSYRIISISTGRCGLCFY